MRHILVRPDITDSDRELAQNNLDSLKQMVIDSTNFFKLVKSNSIDEVPSYGNNGMIQNPNTGKTIFPMSELPSNVYFAIESLEVGDVTEVLDYNLPTGDTYYRIIKLITKTRPHKASLEQDYNKIRTFAKESKKSSYFAEWLESKLAGTYIDIDKNYLVCPDLEQLLSDR